ncbi:MAG: energy transducer TonB [Myxococcota bacterium]
MGRPRPTLALRRTGLAGRVVISFRIAPDGRVLATRVKRSGGHDLLDAAALEFAQGIRRVVPPPPALQWGRDSNQWLSLPIVYARP